MIVIDGTRVGSEHFAGPTSSPGLEVDDVDLRRHVVGVFARNVNYRVELRCKSRQVESVLR